MLSWTKLPRCGVLLGHVALIVSIDANALPRQHSPFFPEEDYVLPLTSCEPGAVTIENQFPAVASVMFRAADGRSLLLRMDGQAASSEAQPYRERYVARITDRGVPVTAEMDVPLIGGVTYLLPDRAICTDVNGDGVTDFITDHSKHGNGLGALFYDRLMILSTPSGAYRFWTIGTMAPSSLDYVSFGQIEPIVMVTTSFANSGGALAHSYLVYDLWKFRDGMPVLANDIDARFPKWVWMTYTENHMPASSLSIRAKQSMRNVKTAIEVVPR